MITGKEMVEHYVSTPRQVAHTAPSVMQTPTASSWPRDFGGLQLKFKLVHHIDIF